MLLILDRAGLPARRAALCLALLLPPAAAGAATFDVASPDALNAAIAASKPGDLIRLATADYGNIRISGVIRTGLPVRIEPQTGATPRAAELIFTNSSGFAVYGITVTSARHPLVSVSASSDVRLGGLRIHGVTNNKDAWDDANSGLHIRNSQRVTVSNTRLADVRTGMFVQRSKGVVVADNTFEYVREGLNVAATDQLLIYRNRFQEFTPNYALGEHPDAIQFWTTNETVGASNVVIASNYMLLSGYKAVQGLLLGGGGDPGDPDAIFHERIEVRNNIYYGSSRNALRLGGVRHGLMHRNTVLASPNADRNTVDPYDNSGRTSGGLQPAIAYYRAIDGRVERNIATLYSEEPGDYSLTDNVDVWDSKTGDGVPVESIFAKRPTGNSPALKAFAVLKGSLADQLDAGAVPPSVAGIQSSSLGNIRKAADYYQGQLANFESWFTPGF
jgi:hypothetical protein